MTIKERANASFSRHQKTTLLLAALSLPLTFWVFLLFIVQGAGRIMEEMT